MTAIGDSLNATRPAARTPWRRIEADEAAWDRAGLALVEGRATLLGLWGERDAVHLALIEPETDAITLLRFNAAAGGFPSLGRRHPPAIRLERVIKDLFGLEPQGAPDARPWLDHGRWGVTAPLGAAAPAGAPAAYPFLPAEGESLHQIPVGPIHAGVIEPGHFRFTANGEAVVRLEERLGYVHKGIEGLMQGEDLERGAKLAGRVSGDSAVAYAIAFARAAEDALGVAVPPRSQWLRALMAELERLGNHLGDIGAICNDAAFPLMHAHCGALRERVLRAADAAFGHRLMRDCVVPGGVAVDLAAEGRAAIHAMMGIVRREFPGLVRLYDETASLQDRTVGAGIVDPALAAQFGAGGYIGRASGRGFDARRRPGYPPYDGLTFAVPSRSEGDVNARVWIRIGEVEQSLGLIAQLTDRLPAGAIAIELPRARGATEGLALVEGFRGDILVWLRLDAAGRIARCHLRDPSWFQWPLLEAAIEGNIVADFPLCNKSFNCSYSGHDL